MNNFQKLQSAKILSSYNQEIEKGRKASPDGTVSKDGTMVKQGSKWVSKKEEKKQTPTKDNSDINVGFTYDFNGVNYKVVDIKDDMYFVVDTSKEKPLKLIEEKEDILSYIKLEESNKESREKQDKRLQEGEEKEVSEIKEKNDLDGFTDNMTSIEAGKVKKFFNDNKVTLNGETKPLKDAVRDMVKTHEIIEFKGKEYIGKDSVFFSGRALSSKTTVEYFKFLQNKNA